MSLLRGSTVSAAVFPKQRLIYPDGSAEKYCSASIMLGKTAEVTHEVESVEVA